MGQQRMIDKTRYSRQILFPPIGETGQQRLSTSRIVIVGLGALGTALANHMVRAGVGFVRLIDRDFVEESNLQRQMLFDEADAREGIPKAIAAEKKLRGINSTVHLEAHVADVSWNNAETLLTDVDLILDGSDNFALRYLINDVSIKRRIPWIYGGVVSSRGMTFTIRPGITPCLRCLFPEAPVAGTAETCDTVGVLGPAVHLVTAHQGVEALKLLIGKTEALDRRLRHFDLWQNRHIAMKVRESPDPHCPTCGQRQFEHLDPRNKEAQAVSLCGRNTVQITPSGPVQLDMELLSNRLARLGTVRQNRFLLRVEIDGYRLVLFPDGRILVQGTEEVHIARTLVAKYVGI